MDRIAQAEPDPCSAKPVTPTKASSSSPKKALSPKGTVVNGNAAATADAATKKTAEGLAGLYDSDDDDASGKDGGLDALFLVRNKPEEIERYVIHLRKMLLEGEGETVIEIGAPIDQGGKASGIPTKDMEAAVGNHLKALATIPAIGTKIETRTNGESPLKSG